MNIVLNNNNKQVIINKIQNEKINNIFKITNEILNVMKKGSTVNCQLVISIQYKLKLIKEELINIKHAIHWARLGIIKSIMLSKTEIRHHRNKEISSQIETTSNNSANSIQRLIDAPLPSPGPLLGKTPLVDSYNNSSFEKRKSEEVIIMKVHDENRSFNKEYSPKPQRFNNYPLSQSQQQSMSTSVHELNSTNALNHLVSGNGVNLSSADMSNTKTSFSMCGGEVQMLEKKDDRMKGFLSSGGCVNPISKCLEVEMSPKMIRTPLLSGGSFTEIPTATTPMRTKLSPMKPSSTPKMMIPVASLTPSLPAPNLLTAGLPLGQHFQFPPINSIAAYNLLTLPPVTMDTIMPSSVLHGDKIIPFVPGIPGPSSLVPLSVPVIPQRGGDNSNLNRILGPKKTSSPILQSSMSSPEVIHQQHAIQPMQTSQVLSSRYQLQKPVIHIEREETPPPPQVTTDFICAPQKSLRNLSVLNNSSRYYQDDLLF